MHIRPILALALPFLLSPLMRVSAQDTFSMVAVDSVTGEVGGIGASCVHMAQFPQFETDFLSELFPGKGAINSQAWYLPENQDYARSLMNAGYAPSVIIDSLVANDVQGTPELRQYGIAALVDGSPVTAAHTGSGTDDYKNHILGPNYSIQGNILLGQQVLDSMEYNFLNTEGDLACKLMAALQGANMIGADSRCAPRGTSSLFAFLKVAQPNDSFGTPSLLVSIETPLVNPFEPIDSLQSLFTLVHGCPADSVPEDTIPDVPQNILEIEEEGFILFPNPADDELTIQLKETGEYALVIRDINGRSVYEDNLNANATIDVSTLAAGKYTLGLKGAEGVYLKHWVKN
ncbi:MAG: DUF1028 domain-containing protein [Flavobacteriales bacterium]|nr:DUF1028 domain-containing protein [Flavobacteriales bacterium]